MRTLIVTASIIVVMPILNAVSVASSIINVITQEFHIDGYVAEDLPVDSYSLTGSEPNQMSLYGALSQAGSTTDYQRVEAYRNGEASTYASAVVSYDFIPLVTDVQLEVNGTVREDSHWDGYVIETWGHVSLYDLTANTSLVNYGTPTGTFGPGEISMPYSFGSTMDLSLNMDHQYRLMFQAYANRSESAGWFTSTEMSVTIPEPASLSLLALGGLAILRRRSR